MQKKITVSVTPAVAADERALLSLLRSELALSDVDILSFRVERRSIDARGRRIVVNLTIIAYINEPADEEKITIDYRDVSGSDKICHIIGAGPAGLFAALRCIRLGIKPVIIERGKDVRARRRDLAAINRDHIVNPDSNYCFGEGGAGTYSDGKLYTRSGKRGDVNGVLRALVYHGAPADILVDAHPHIGTNKLPAVIEQIRQTILQCGGEIHFETRLTGLKLEGERLKAIALQSPKGAVEFPVSHVIIATGHSARDIYELLAELSLQIEAKPFAMGVRVEHPQELIDQVQYHCRSAAEVADARRYLPAASYAFVHQAAGGRGVYSFCMCPGGIIAPCATAQEEVVTNGWSPSKRNNPYANSGIVVSLSPEDYHKYAAAGSLAGLRFQQELEHRAWIAGGKTQTAPAQRLTDFVARRNSASLPGCSYQPGIRSADLSPLLGPVIGPALREGFAAFGKKMRGYMTSEAVVVGVESRTSTPVRIPRDKESLHHPQVINLYPCGEGAGYAGGIVSAAMDGERCAEALRY